VAGYENVLTDPDVASELAISADAHVVADHSDPAGREKGRCGLNVNVSPVEHPSIAQPEHIKGADRVAKPPVD
jgi:hypothetical protein